MGRTIGQEPKAAQTHKSDIAQGNGADRQLTHHSENVEKRTDIDPICEA